MIPPDADRIAFISDRTGPDELWVADSEGGNPRQPTQLGIPLDDVSWDPTGKSIAFSVVSGKVFLVSLENGSLQLLFNGKPFTDERVPNIVFSQNGDFVYVLSQPGTGEEYELLKVPVAGGSPRKVMDGLLTNFAESADGKTLFYSRAKGIWKRSVDGEDDRFVAPASGIWDLRPDGLYILANDSTIQQYSFSGKPLRTVAKFGQFDLRFPMSISPDNRWALIGFERRQVIEIDMLQGFN